MNTAAVTSLVAIAVTLVFSMITLWRSARKEDASETERQTTMIVKLETISGGIAEIKADLRSLREEIKDHETRLVRLEERTRAAQHTLEEKKGLKNNEH